MTVPAGLSLHNQTTASDEDFVANFVARHETLDSVLRRLRSPGADGGDLHQILIGPRGMGKTSLLRRIAIAIDRDPDLAARYIPLTFREEQYNVLTLGDFWRNCGEALAEWAEARGPAGLAGRLDRALANKDWAIDSDAAERFQAEIVALQRRAVLLVDNLSLILDALSDTDNWTLRRHLQGRLGPIVIGAATQPLRQSADHGAAFYEFFQPVHLEPLDEHETEHCVRALAAARGENGKPVLEVMNRQPERLRTLHTLTGGNPRVLALIYRLLEAGQSDAAMADLDILLDHVTPYYKARVEEYETPQQRAVIDAIALHWDPVTTGGLSGLTNIPSTTLSPLLIRLRRDGLIESVETSGSYAGHQLVERFFNIWYLMRHGTRRVKQKMRWLVAFLTSFYSPRELDDIVRRASDSGAAGAWPEEYALAFEEALARCGSGYLDISLQGGSVSHFAPVGNADIGSEERGGSAGADGWRECLILERQADQLFNAGQYPDCIAALDKAISILKHANDPAWLGAIGGALFNKAIVLGKMGDTDGEIATYDQVFAQLADSLEPAICERFAQTLFNKASALTQIGDYLGALAAWDEFLKRRDGSLGAESTNKVAQATYLRADVLGRMGDRVNALAGYDDLLARFSRSNDPLEIQYVAMAMVDKSFVLGEMGDNAEAIAACDDGVARFASANDPVIQRQVSRALVNKALVLTQMGDNCGSVEISDHIVLSFCDYNDEIIRLNVACALFSKAITLGEGGDLAAAIATYDDMIARFTDLTDFTLRAIIARSHFNRAFMLARMKNILGAVEAYDGFISRFSCFSESSINSLIARALVNQSAALGELGRFSAAVLVCNEVVSRFGSGGETAMPEQVAKALVNKGKALRSLGEVLGAIAAYEDLLERYHVLPGGTELETLASAQIGLASLLIDACQETSRAEDLYLAAALVHPLLANANLAWLYLLTDRVPDAERVRSELGRLPPDGLALLDAGIALAGDNFGAATNHLAPVVGEKLDGGGMDFYDDLERFLRLAARLEYGERLLAWFEESGFAERVAPVYAAFTAYVRGASHLLDVNPEVRRPAQVIYDRLDAPWRFARDGAPKVATASGKRGRGRRKRGG